MKEQVLSGTMLISRVGYIDSVKSVQDFQSYLLFMVAEPARDTDSLVAQLNFHRCFRSGLRPRTWLTSMRDSLNS